MKARNQGVRRIMNQMLAIAPWLCDSDRPALRAWCELEWLTRRMLVLSEPDLEREKQLKCSVEDRAIRHTQNTIGNGLGLNAASRKQLAITDKTRDIIGELAAAASTGNGK
jgi:hypothetical protein